MNKFGKRFSEIKEIHVSLQSTLYEAIDIINNEPVVIKHASQCNNIHENELKIYNRLRRKTGTTVAPKLVWKRKFKDGAIAYAVEKLGPNLEQLYDSINRRMSLKTLLKLGDLMVKCVEQLHSHGILHCDISPENFVFGRGNDSNHLYLIGFSRAEIIGENVARPLDKRFSRRASYQSLSSQLGFKHGCRDDLESIGLMLVYFHEGQLPWQGILAENDETRFDLIARIKSLLKIKKLCANLPESFENYFNLCWRLKVDEVPNYNEFRKVFRQLFILNKFRRDLSFDWTVKPSNEYQDLDKIEEMPDEDEGIRGFQKNLLCSSKVEMENVKQKDSDLERNKSEILAQAILNSSDDFDLDDFDLDDLDNYDKT